jgi:hypothetical protein
LGTIGDPRKDNEASVSKNNESQKEGDPTEKQMFLAPEFKPIPLGGQESKKKWYKSIPWWKFWEGAGILAVIVYAVLTYLQWSDLRHNFFVDQRGWVKIESGFPESVAVGSSVSELPVFVRNIGKSPTTRTVVDVVVEVVQSTVRPTFDFNQAHNAIDISLMFPSDVQQIAGHFFVGQQRTSLSAADLQNLREGRAYLVIFGQAAYADQFGKHWTRFCRWHSYSTGGGTFNADSCVAWNTVGDGDIPTQR